MPKHIWENATFQVMTSNTQLNLFTPIGSGPYKVIKLEQNNDKKITSIDFNAPIKIIILQPEFKNSNYLLIIK